MGLWVKSKVNKWWWLQRCGKKWWRWRRDSALTSGHFVLKTTFISFLFLCRSGLYTPKFSKQNVPFVLIYMILSIKTVVIVKGSYQGNSYYCLSFKISYDTKQCSVVELCWELFHLQMSVLIFKYSTLQFKILNTTHAWWTWLRKHNLNQ